MKITKRSKPLPSFFPKIRGISDCRSLGLWIPRRRDGCYAAAGSLESGWWIVNCSVIEAAGIACCWKGWQVFWDASSEGWTIIDIGSKGHLRDTSFKSSDLSSKICESMCEWALSLYKERILLYHSHPISASLVDWVLQRSNSMGGWRDRYVMRLRSRGIEFDDVHAFWANW